MERNELSIGDKVLFVKPNPLAQDEGVMDKYIGRECIIKDLANSQYDFIVTFLIVNADFEVYQDELVKITPLTKVLYGL